MSVIKTANPESIKEAADIIRSGGLVGMPTETVYGLAADATNGRAVAKIFEAKGRPAFNPLISHFARSDDILSHVNLRDEAVFRALVEAFWPGPLTLVLPRASASNIAELVTAGLDTLAVRVPAHKVARDLIRAAGVPLAAPSANISGTISATTPVHVAEGLGKKVDMILAAGPCEVGLESTVLDLSGAVPVILRPGGVTAEQIEEVLGVHPELAESNEVNPKSPGMLLKHYAPSIPLRLNAADLKPGEALLAFGSDKFMGIRGGGAAKDLPPESRMNLSEEGDLHEAAANLFAMLRALDKPHHAGIAVMAIPGKGLGVAINDRLRRAAAK